MLGFTGLLLLVAIPGAITAPTHHQAASQHVLDVSDASAKVEGTRRLQGRFLHITDIHPDPFYKSGSNPNGRHPCHRGKGAAGYYGAEKTECDSPFALIDATFDWIKHNIRDEIDFVVWTGDSARHDNDWKYPRSKRQVEQLNRYVTTKFKQAFAHPVKRPGSGFDRSLSVPIIPTFGNNDVLPHNILEAGPNWWTIKYLDIWEDFIPQAQRHSFARGGWFFTEVIPGRLAVFSLNTMYFFESNAAVDGCDDPNQPGYEHFEWLRVQLQIMRRRGMKAIFTGHVPPAKTESKSNWDESCHQKYILWLRQFRDVVVGNFFGHMNIDHFMFQDTHDLTYKFKIPGLSKRERARQTHSGDVDALAKADYLTELRTSWSALPTPPKGYGVANGTFSDTSLQQGKRRRKQYEKFLNEIGGAYGERFSVSLVSPSVVPNFYPTLRLIEYNISGLEHIRMVPTHAALLDSEDGDRKLDVADQRWQTASKAGVFGDRLDGKYEGQGIHEDSRGKRKKGKKKPNFVIPHPPSKASTPGPAYSPQTLSLTSFTQLYANITKINEAVRNELELAIPAAAHDDETALLKQHLTFEVEYCTTNDSQYKMRDLTMRSWLDLAERIGRAEYKKKDEKAPSSTEEFDTVMSEIGDMVEPLEEDPESTDTRDETRHRKKKKHRGGKSVKQNRVWRTFVQRAFVSTKSDKELENEFE